MSAPLRMDPIADDGFYQTIEPELARRQFNMSLGLLALLTLVAIAFGVTAGFSPLEHSDFSNRQARIVVQSPQRVHVMQAQESVTHGG